MNRNQPTPSRIQSVVDLLIGTLPARLDQRIEILQTVATLVPQAHPAQKQILELLHPLELHATRQREFLFSPSLSPAGQNVTRAQLAAAVADGWVVSNAGVWTSAGMVRVLRRGDVETFVIVEE
ncbi:MAG: hypothetical protein U1G08_17815 [Verrucomicrobiota bacterium]